RRVLRHGRVPGGVEVRPPLGGGLRPDRHRPLRGGPGRARLRRRAPGGFRADLAKGHGAARPGVDRRAGRLQPQQGARPAGAAAGADLRATAMPTLTCEISETLMRALAERSARTGEPPAHIVMSALADALEVEHATLFQVSTSAALVKGVYNGVV